MDTPTENFASLKAFHDKALADLDRSLALTAKPYLSHRYRMIVARHRSGLTAVQPHYLEAMKLAPQSIETRLAYMNALEPRWGGSLELMEQFVKDSKASVTESKDLAKLQARLPAYRAFEARSAKNYPRAVSELEIAIALSDNADSRCERAYVLGELKRHAEAFADIQRALALAPDREYCLRIASNAATRAPDADRVEVIRILTHVIDQGAATAYTFNQRGFRYQEQGRLEPAYADYLASAKLDDGWGQLMTGKSLWAGRGTPENREAAMVWLKKAADKGDRDAVVSYSEAQHLLRAAKK